MSLRALSLALCGLFACSGPADPAPLPAAPVAARPVTPPDAKEADDGKVSLLPAVNSPTPAKEPPLTQEELDLLAADPATLTPEMRRKRSFALRRKILQNPDSPTARQLEALRIAYERGELQPQLPEGEKTSKPGDSGIILKARQPAPGPTQAATAAPTPAPGGSEPAKAP